MRPGISTLTHDRNVFLLFWLRLGKNIIYCIWFILLCSAKIHTSKIILHPISILKSDVTSEWRHYYHKLRVHSQYLSWLIFYSVVWNMIATKPTRKNILILCQILDVHNIFPILHIFKYGMGNIWYHQLFPPYFSI